MVIPKDQDGKSDQCVMLQREQRRQVINTRHGGQKNDANERDIIIVDMREFRSELPALIHKRGIDIEPLTITVIRSTYIQFNKALCSLGLDVVCKYYF